MKVTKSEFASNLQQAIKDRKVEKERLKDKQYYDYMSSKCCMSVKNRRTIAMKNEKSNC